MKEFLKGRIKSFGFALNGLRIFFTTQTNAKIELVAAIFVVVISFGLKINTPDWITIIFCIGLVFSMEIVNTSIEYLTNLVSPDYNEIAGKVKDLASAAVLVVAIASAIIAIMVFCKYLPV